MKFVTPLVAAVFGVEAVLMESSNLQKLMERSELHEKSKSKHDVVALFKRFGVEDVNKVPLEPLLSLIEKRDVWASHSPITTLDEFLQLAQVWTKDGEQGLWCATRETSGAADFLLWIADEKREESLKTVLHKNAKDANRWVAFQEGVLNDWKTSAKEYIDPSREKGYTHQVKQWGGQRTNPLAEQMTNIIDNFMVTQDSTFLAWEHRRDVLRSLFDLIETFHGNIKSWGWDGDEFRTNEGKFPNDFVSMKNDVLELSKGAAKKTVLNTKFLQCIIGVFGEEEKKKFDQVQEKADLPEKSGFLSLMDEKYYETAEMVAMTQIVFQLTKELLNAAKDSKGELFDKIVSEALTWEHRRDVLQLVLDLIKEMQDSDLRYLNCDDDVTVECQTMKDRVITKLSAGEDKDSVLSNFLQHIFEYEKMTKDEFEDMAEDAFELIEGLLKAAQERNGKLFDKIVSESAQ